MVPHRSSSASSLAERATPEIAAPTLVIAGGEDWVSPPVGSRTLAATIPAASHVELPDAGHFAFAEAPEAFHDAVCQFLQREILVRR